MKVQRAERTVIRKNHPKFQIVDAMCFSSKSLYNEANYELRQKYIGTGGYTQYRDMNREYKTHENYKACYSQPANCTLRLLHKNWKSFFRASADYEKHPEKYIGKPKIPKYLPKDGRYIWMIPNNSFQYDYKTSTIHFGLRILQGYEWKCRCLGRPIQVRFVPQGTCYVMEVVYEIEVPDTPKGEPNRIASIDLGVNNLMTITNNIGLEPIIVSGRVVKSINQFYNKRKAELQSDLAKRNGQHWSKRLNSLTFKRQCRVRNYFHNATAYVVKWCVENEIDTLVVGKNKNWKQGKDGMQNFKSIPYSMLLRQLEHKCQNAGIRYVEVYESYTSGTSFLDHEEPTKENYNITRRITRGLFQADYELVNADVNGSLQIMRKAFPNAVGYGIAVCLTPTVINAVKAV